jgi:hypothetical protein
LEIEKVKEEIQINPAANHKFEIAIFNCILNSFENLEIPKVMTINEFLIYQKKMSLFISKAFGISLDISTAAIRLYGSEKEQIKSLNRNKILTNFNIHDLNVLSPIKLNPSVQIDNCSICLNSFEIGEMFVLPCLHYACTTCWKNHIINQKSSSPRTCFQCKYPLSDEIIETFVDDSFLTNYSDEIISHQISCGKQFKRCTSPKCNKIWNSRGAVNSIFECECGARAC